MKKGLLSLCCLLFSMSYALASEHPCLTKWNPNQNITDILVGAYGNRIAILTATGKWYLTANGIDTPLGKAFLSLAISALNSGNKVAFNCSNSFITTLYLEAK